MSILTAHNSPKITNLLHCSEHAKQQFHSYFEFEMTAAAIKSYHGMGKMENCEKNSYIAWEML